MKQVTASVIMLTLIGCSGTENPPAHDVTDPLVLEGQVRFLDVEGGCWGLQTDSLTYEPVGGFPTGFRQDQLAVRAAVREVDAASICMIGPLVEIVTIETMSPSP